MSEKRVVEGEERETLDRHQNVIVCARAVSACSISSLTKYIVSVNSFYIHILNVTGFYTKRKRDIESSRR